MTPGQTEQHDRLMALYHGAWQVDLRRFPGRRWAALRRSVVLAREVLDDATDMTFQRLEDDREAAERANRLPGLRGDD